MRFPYTIRPTRFLVALMFLGITLFCTACDSAQAKADPITIDITPDFSEFNFIAKDSEPPSLDKITSSNRCKVYAETRYDYGGRFSTYYEAKYQGVGNALAFLHAQINSSTPTVVDFYWYGYASTANAEQITLTIADKKCNRKDDTSAFTVTSNYANQDSDIYKSFLLEGYTYSLYIDVSPYAQTKVYSREQFSDAITSGELPEEYVLYDTPPDADYICKASIQISF